MAASKTYLVDVSIINKTTGREAVSYFSAEKIAPGTLVNVPLRKSSALAVALRSRSVMDVKSHIRRAGFPLRKIPGKNILKAGLDTKVVDALDLAADYYAAPLGSVLASLAPKAILEDPAAFLPVSAGKRRARLMDHRENFLLQMEPEERMSQYRALVRQSFARGSSVMFVVPTHLDISRAAAELSTGIGEFVHTFALEKKSDAKKAWKNALAEKHPILFITTPAGVMFNRPDLSLVIIERENSRSYRSLSRPYLNAKTFLKFLCEKTGKQLVMGDSVLSLESLWMEKEGLYGEASLIRWRLSGAPTSLVDASIKQDENGGFEIFSNELKSLMEKALSESGAIFLFGARKGLAPTTVCGDCGHILPCLNCGAPVVLHKAGAETIYICHACGSRRDSTTACGHCKSWKLVPLGIGTEEIARQAHELFPEANTQILDKDYASTDKRARMIAERFEKEGGILVGTELAFFHLRSVPYSAAVSVDALFSVPDFGISERVFYLISRMRELTRHEAMIQTRNIGRQILSWASSGNIIDFYQAEIADRESLLYPPFSIFVKIDSRFKIKDSRMVELKERFAKWQPEMLKDSLIIRLKREAWPDPELAEHLSLLGPEFSIKVDPESIL
jgi:primosomal protein N'